MDNYKRYGIINDPYIIDTCNITDKYKTDDLTRFYCQRDNENRKKYITILVLIILVFIVTIILGSIIFMFMFDLTWIDALYASSLILTGIDIEVTPITNFQKIFIIFYALLTVTILLSMANVAVQYSIHLFGY